MLDVFEFYPDEDGKLLAALVAAIEQARNVAKLFKEGSVEHIKQRHFAIIGDGLMQSRFFDGAVYRITVGSEFERAVLQSVAAQAGLNLGEAIFYNLSSRP